MHYLLTYQYSDDYLQRRGEFRNAHLRQAWEWQARGALLIGGAVGDPADSAGLVFDCDSAADIEQVVQTDAYFQNGLVRSYTIQPWTPVVGKDAKTPIQPQE